MNLLESCLTYNDDLIMFASSKKNPTDISIHVFTSKRNIMVSGERLIGNTTLPMGGYPGVNVSMTGCHLSML